MQSPASGHNTLQTRRSDTDNSPFTCSAHWRRGLGGSEASLGNLPQYLVVQRQISAAALFRQPFPASLNLVRTAKQLSGCFPLWGLLVQP